MTADDLSPHAADHGLSAELLKLTRALRDAFPRQPAQIRQPTDDLQEAYAQAKALSNEFLSQLTHFGTLSGARATPRPEGIKSWSRTEEKGSLFGLVPLDILGGKYVFDQLAPLYAAAARIGEGFEVLAFQDRFLRPQSSGYRDLQFVVSVEGHAAEVKFCHAAFDELDAYEHRLYEMRRVLERKAELSPIERIVLDTLIDASTLMYQQVWASVSAEGGGE
ncbi:hypothetical protein [Deinococcus multiflagellatus]|uniref:Uncharacterized protein n=1 Tax=Deinococcus multiflagellatus TaxID=1656887 RepID=A0ABW1ZRP9_9DEIO|nr:hypothetical protein [Deinococcus multiflagellatus]MBZ9715405.1 hypothetical protein [Deinococcus multiflagellatus]